MPTTGKNQYPTKNLPIVFPMKVRDKTMSAMWKNHESGGNKLTKLMVKVWSALPIKHTELNPMFEAQKMLLTRCELKSFSKATKGNIRASPLTRCELKTFCIAT
jgi:hypothetical protein